MSELIFRAVTVHTMRMVGGRGLKTLMGPARAVGSWVVWGDGLAIPISEVVDAQVDQTEIHERAMRAEAMMGPQRYSIPEESLGGPYDVVVENLHSHESTPESPSSSGATSPPSPSASSTAARRSRRRRR